MVEQLCKAGSHDAQAQLNLWLNEALADEKSCYTYKAKAVIWGLL